MFAEDDCVDGGGKWRRRRSSQMRASVRRCHFFQGAREELAAHMQGRVGFQMLSTVGSRFNGPKT